MKKIYMILSLFISSSALYAQTTWDTVMTGISPVGSKLPGCYGVSKAGGKLYGSTSTALYQSSDNGSTWTPKSVRGLILYSPKGVFAAGSGRLLCYGGYKYAIIKSDDNGNTWDTTMAFPNGSAGEDILMTSTGTLYAAIWNNLNNNTNGIYTSTDNGSTWTVKYAFTQSNQRVWTLHKVSDSILLAGTNYGIYRSTDAGTTWSGVGLNGSSLKIVTKLTRNNNGTLYAATSGNGVYKSTDDGATWTASSMVSSSSSATYYDVETDQSGNIYLAQYNGGVLKFDASEAFTEMFANDSNGLFNKRVYDLFIDESGSAPLYFISCDGATAGSDLNGYFFRRGIARTNTSVNDMNPLSQVVCYPNPATHKVHVANLPENSQIKVTDLNGRVVMHETSGYNTTLNISTLPAGMYLLQIENNGMRAQQKLIKY